ncbi:hypothetical protein M0811_12067 [Anaeramoeba ignava]|uniref:Uncharacterized protein n=1 Tax=Anaeramoeba ignava TaxID=1746090 RepID=A0A9Q0LBH6_ANAIG|nr:hypothetical protein M0811_12067 [Anaeramoeba ignava]
MFLSVTEDKSNKVTDYSEFKKIYKNDRKSNPNPKYSKKAKIIDIKCGYSHSMLIENEKNPKRKLLFMWILYI